MPFTTNTVLYYSLCNVNSPPLPTPSHWKCVLHTLLIIIPSTINLVLCHHYLQLFTITVTSQYIYLSVLMAALRPSNSKRKSHQAYRRRLVSGWHWSQVRTHLLIEIQIRLRGCMDIRCIHIHASGVEIEAGGWMAIRYIHIHASGVEMETGGWMVIRYIHIHTSGVEMETGGWMAIRCMYIHASGIEIMVTGCKVHTYRSSHYLNVFILPGVGG